MLRLALESVTPPNVGSAGSGEGWFGKERREERREGKGRNGMGGVMPLC
jgi:hypothetical protein